MPRRGENIYKRKDGRWEARYVKEITADGKKKYGSVYAGSYKEVKAKQQLCILQPTENHNSISITVTELIAEWLESIKNQVKPCTYQKYECVCRNHITSDLGTIAVRYISRFTIMSFTEKLLEKNLSTKTVNDILIVLGLALKYAQETYSITTPKINYVKEYKKEMRVLSVQEQQVITEYMLQQIDIHKFGVLLALYTGMRIGELCALRWDDITDEHIIINKTMMRIKSEHKQVKRQKPGQSEMLAGSDVYYRRNEWDEKKRNFVDGDATSLLTEDDDEATSLLNDDEDEATSLLMEDEDEATSLLNDDDEATSLLGDNSLYQRCPYLIRKIPLTELILISLYSESEKKKVMSIIL